MVGLCLAVLLSLGSASAFAKVQIRLINLDSPGEGLNDITPATPVGGNPGTTLGEQRLNALRYAADLLEVILSSDVTIEIGVRFDEQGGTAFSAALAAAGPNTYHYDFEGALVPQIWHVQALANKLYGSDLATASDCATIENCYDVSATFNSSIDEDSVLGSNSWYYGYDGPTATATTQGSDFDLITVAVHEWLHGIGFISFVNFSNGAFLPTSDNQQILPDLYSSYIRLQDGDPESFISMSNAQRLTAMRSTGRLQWTGPLGNQAAANAADGVQDGHVQLYAPDPIEFGASVSHIDTSFEPDQMMEPYYTRPGHSLGIAAAFLADIGWGNYTDLAVNFAAGANPASRVDTTEYYIAVSNRGNSSAPDTFVEYTLPTDTALISASLTIGSSTNAVSCQSTGSNLITCPIGTLGAGVTQILTLTVQHSSNGAITHVGSIYGDIVDGSPDNNAFSETTDVSNGPQNLVAEAGPVSQAISGNAVQLDGTNSTSTNSAISEYNYQQLTGTTVLFDEVSPGVISFTTPSGTEDLLFRLTVTAENSATSSDFALISINSPPTANTGANQTVLINTVVSLSGSNSTDSDGSIATYAWQQTSGPSVSLSDANTANPTFTAPERALDLAFELTVTDNEGASATSQTNVSVVSNLQATSSGGDGGGGRLDWFSLIALTLLTALRVRSKAA